MKFLITMSSSTFLKKVSRLFLKLLVESTTSGPTKSLKNEKLQDNDVCGEEYDQIVNQHLRYFDVLQRKYFNFYLHRWPNDSSDIKWSFNHGGIFNQPHGEFNCFASIRVMKNYTKNEHFAIQRRILQLLLKFF